MHAAQATLQAKLASIRDANRRLTREMAARRKADNAMRRNNQALAATIQQLEAIHRDGAHLSHMAELLQACTQRSEAYAIVRETGAQLFPDSYGSLFILRESRDVLEHVTAWGSGPAPEKTLVPEDRMRLSPANRSWSISPSRSALRRSGCIRSSRSGGTPLSPADLPGRPQALAAICSVLRGP